MSQYVDCTHGPLTNAEEVNDNEAFIEYIFSDYTISVCKNNNKRYIFCTFDNKLDLVVGVLVKSPTRLLAQLIRFTQPRLVF